MNNICTGEVDVSGSLHGLFGSPASVSASLSFLFDIYISDSKTSFPIVYVVFTELKGTLKISIAFFLI